MSEARRPRAPKLRRVCSTETAPKLARVHIFTLGRGKESERERDLQQLSWKPPPTSRRLPKAARLAASRWWPSRVY